MSGTRPAAKHADVRETHLNASGSVTCRLPGVGTHLDGRARKARIGSGWRRVVVVATGVGQQNTLSEPHHVRRELYRPMSAALRCKCASDVTNVLHALHLLLLRRPARSLLSPTRPHSHGLRAPRGDLRRRVHGLFPCTDRAAVAPCGTSRLRGFGSGRTARVSSTAIHWFGAAARNCFSSRVVHAFHPLRTPVSACGAP